MRKAAIKASEISENLVIGLVFHDYHRMIIW